MKVEVVVTPETVRETGVQCCDTFTLDFYDTETGLPLRERGWVFYLFTNYPYECYHQNYYARPIIINPPEFKAHNVAEELPLNVSIHRSIYCEQCPAMLGVFFNTGPQWQWIVRYFQVNIAARDL
jgi:hypothetical protein